MILRPSSVPYLLLGGIILPCLASPGQAPLSSKPEPSLSSMEEPPLISQGIREWTEDLLKNHSSPGLSVAVLIKDPTSPSGTGFRTEFASFGVARADGTPVTPDTLFAIASNSKLFTAASVGLLIANETLREERGEKALTWMTKAEDVLPGWKLADEFASKETTLLDMLVHRTGVPRHDYAGKPWKNGVRDVIQTLRYLKPSAPFRSTWQYNNMMFEALTLLPEVVLNQTFESYVEQHLFAPLNMTKSTYSIANAEAQTYPGEGNTTKTFAHGHLHSLRDFYVNKTGYLKPNVPYFARPGEEKVWAGAGGIITSTRDLSKWLAMLMNGGVDPLTNETVIPATILDRIERGASVPDGKASWPELSPKVYAPAQIRYSYRGHELIEHGGNNPGYKTQVARFLDLGPVIGSASDGGALKDFPNATVLGIISLSNDEDGDVLLEAVKWRIADELFGLEPIDWYSRYREDIDNFMSSKRSAALPRPASPEPPTLPLYTLLTSTYSHPTYGDLVFCPAMPADAHVIAGCNNTVEHPTARLILANTPEEEHPYTFITPFKKTFASHLRLTHWSANWFNVTVIWGNQDKHTDDDDDGMMWGLDEKFEVEWVVSDDGHGDQGLAFRGGIWGMQGADAKAPEGYGQGGAEIWFRRVSR